MAKSINLPQTSLGRLSVGYFSGNDQLLVNADGRSDNEGVFAAWERTMTEISDKLWLCVEYMGTESSYGSWSVGASWKFAPDVSMIGGYTAYNNENLVSTATLQLDIDIR
jgi:hypothetical protein